MNTFQEEENAYAVLLDFTVNKTIWFPEIGVGGSYMKSDYQNDDCRLWISEKAELLFLKRGDGEHTVS